MNIVGLHLLEDRHLYVMYADRTSGLSNLASDSLN